MSVSYLAGHEAGDAEQQNAGDVQARRIPSGTGGAERQGRHRGLGGGGLSAHRMEETVKGSTASGGLGCGAGTRMLAGGVDAGGRGLVESAGEVRVKPSPDSSRHGGSGGEERRTQARADVEVV